MTVVRPYSQWGVARDRRRTSGSRASRRSRGWTIGSTAASSSASRPSSTSSRTTACSSASRSSGSPRPAGWAPIATTASGTAWTPTRTRSRSTTSGAPAGRRGESGIARRGERVSVPRWSPARAASSAAGWRRRCSSAATRVVSFDRRRRTERPSAIGMLGIEDDLVQVEADLTDAAEVGAVLDEHGVDTVFHLAAETIVATVAASPAPGLRVERARHVDGARGVPRARACERVVFASSDKAYGAHDELALPRGLRAAADGAVRGVEGGGGPDRAQLLALLRAARSP